MFQTLVVNRPKWIDDSDDNYEYDIWYDYPQYENDVKSEKIYNDSKPAALKKSNTPETRDLSDLPPGIYCDLVTTIDKACFELSLLEIWLYDEETIAKLTQQEILDKVNSLHVR